MFARAGSWVIAAVGAVLLAATPACSSGGSSGTAASTSATSASVSTTSAASVTVPFTADLATSAPAGAITVNLVDLKFNPSEVDVHAGHVVLFLENTEQPCPADLDHDTCKTRDHGMWVVGADGQAVAKALVLHPGQSETFTIDLGAGSDRLVCPLPGHATQGMTGTIVLTA
jgi:uncharacterized cupredoxin-like copper-binding protein